MDTTPLKSILKDIDTGTINIKRNVFEVERRDIFNHKRVTPGEDSQRMITPPSN